MKKKVVKTILMIVMLLLFTTVVEAAEDSYSMGISANKSTIQAGEKVEVTLSLKDIKISTGDKGIGAYQATIEYDKDIFEYESIKGLNSWDTPIYNNGTFATTTSTGEVIKNKEDVVKITLKAKESIRKESTTIKVKNITASTGTNTVSTGSVSKNIGLVTTSAPAENAANSAENVAKGENKGTSSSKKTATSSTSSKADKTTSSKKLPKTGLASVGIYVYLGASALAIILLSAIIVAVLKK